jgi:hypothetical protein
MLLSGMFFEDCLARIEALIRKSLKRVDSILKEQFQYRQAYNVFAESLGKSDQTPISSRARNLLPINPYLVFEFT